MSWRVGRFLALVAAVAATLVACSSPGERGAVPAPGASTAAGGFSTPSPGGTLGTPPTAGGFGTASPQPAGSPGGSPPPDFVYASPQDGNSWGCDFEAGDRCRIRFDGRYRLTTESTASIEAAAWEDGSTAPAKWARLPIPRPGGSLFFIELPYRVPAGVKTVTFGTRLLDDAGRVLHEGLRYTATVGRVWHKRDT